MEVFSFYVHVAYSVFPTARARSVPGLGMPFHSVTSKTPSAAAINDARHDPRVARALSATLGQVFAQGYTVWKTVASGDIPWF